MIKLYSKKNCPFCNVAEHILREAKITYEKIDIMEDEKAREFLIKEGHKTVPQIYKDDTLAISGGAQTLKKMSLMEVKHRLGE